MNVDLHYECVGSGSPVVVLHGLFGAGRNWLSVARRMSADYAFYLVDLRNHGRSAHHPSMTYLDMVGDVQALIGKLGLQNFVLVGHSMGGKVAMTMVLNGAVAPARLVNVDIAPVSYHDRFADMITAMRAIDLSLVARRADADILLQEAIPDLSVRQFILQNLMFDKGEARWRANLPALQDQMPNILGPLPVPDNATYNGETWFIRGELSDRITAAQMPLIKRYFNHYRIETVAGGGHWPHAEAPAAFMSIFEAALQI